jgi:hypothetical protein
VNIARHRSTGSSAGEWPAKRAGVGRMANRSPVRRDAAPEPGRIGELEVRLDHHGLSRSGRSRGEVELELAGWGWLGRGGGRAPRPRSASTRAMSSGLLAIFTKRIAPRQRGQVMMSTANTRCSSHAQGCRAGCLAITSSSVAAPPSDNGICIGSVGTDTGPGTTLPELKTVPSVFGAAHWRGPRAPRDTAACESAVAGSGRIASLGDRAGRARPRAHHSSTRAESCSDTGHRR